MKNRNKVMICGALIITLGYEVYAIYNHDFWKIDQQPATEAVSPAGPPAAKPDYREDRLWSQCYSKQGDRSTRYSTDADHPRFKPKYLKWEGKEYCPTSKLSQVTESVLKRMPHINSNDRNMTRLVVETAIAESQGGYFVTSTRGDYGMFQIRVSTAKSLLEWLRSNHRDIYEAINKFRNNDLSLEDNLQYNVPFGVAVCISEYWRKAGPELHRYIQTHEDRAKLWKSVYNTRYGRGTVNAYLNRSTQYIASR